MQMNEVCRAASGAVQRAVTMVVCMIGEPGQPAGDRDPPKEETPMFKTISAALVAVSVLAAPAFAGTAAKTFRTPVTKTVQAPVIKADRAQARFLNAHAHMGRHHHMHRHHHHHKHMGMLKIHGAPKRG
jgi:hypothetical protein